MHGALRKLAVTVSEEDSKSFSWEVVELLPDGAWTVVESGRRRLRSYHQAMAEGLLALQNRVPDLDIGPREPIQASDDKAHTSPRNVFGFGFGLPKYGHRDDD
jgi:hypothetical protein